VSSPRTGCSESVMKNSEGTMYLSSLRKSGIQNRREERLRRLGVRGRSPALQRLVVCAAVLVAMALTGSAAVCAPSASEAELAATIVAGARTRVEGLKSGVVEFEVLDLRGTVVAKRFVAFDNREGKVRCDTERSLASSPVVRVLHTKTEFVQFVGGGQGPGVFTRLNPGEPSPVLDGMPIDFRAVGFSPYHLLSRGGSAEGTLKALDKRTQSARCRIEQGIAVLSYRIDSTSESVWWFDVSHDYVPLRSEVRILPFVGRPVLRQRLETTWRRLNGTVVPLQSTFELFGDDGKTAVKRDEMRLTWTSANEKVSEDLFAEANLKLPMGTHVVDARLGQPILEGVIGAEGRLPEPPEPRSFAWTLVALSLTVVLGLAVLALMWNRKRRVSPQ